MTRERVRLSRERRECAEVKDRVDHEREKQIAGVKDHGKLVKQLDAEDRNRKPDAVRDRERRTHEMLGRVVGVKSGELR